MLVLYDTEQGKSESLLLARLKSLRAEGPSNIQSTGVEVMELNDVALAACYIHCV